MLILQNEPLRPLELSGLKLTPVPIHSGTSKFDLILTLADNEEGFCGDLEYNTDIFDVADVERQVRQAATSGWQLLQAAKAAIVSDQTQVAADITAVKGVIQEQRAGERSVLDVLNAQQELLNSEVDLANARHDSTVIAYQLLGAAGELTAMSLALDVKFYDPAEHYNRAANAWFSLSD